jgi:hypothetical protein
MSRKIIPIGLDIESSTDNPQTGFILQIGIAHYNDDKIVTKEWLINYPTSFWDGVNWSGDSYRVHQISKEKLQDSGLNIQELDSNIYTYLKNLNQEGIFIPVGFNVGSFDLLFIKKEMPKINSLLSHRTIELNSLFLLHSRKGDYIKEEWADIKNAVINDQISKLKENKLHSAGFDAKLALLILDQFSVSLIE